MWDRFYQEVKNGKKGALATVKVIKEKSDNNLASVLVQFGSGKESTLRLSKRDGRWLITGISFDIFKKIEARPSLKRKKIALIEQYVGRQKDDAFWYLITPELQALVGSDYVTLVNNLAISGPIRREGRFLVVDGNAPLSGGSDEAIIAVDVATGILSAAVMKDGKVTKFSDIKDSDDYPDVIKSWNAAEPALL